MKMSGIRHLARREQARILNCILGTLAYLVLPCLAPASLAQSPASVAMPSPISEAQEATFLAHAKVIASEREQTGITGAYRVTLSDGKLIHDGSFQPIDDSKPVMEFPDGRTEFGFRDTYHFNIAGYQLAKLLGLDNMVPVYVERSWNGMRGSMSWRIDHVAMDEAQRYQKRIPVPDNDNWNKQMYKVRIFHQLIYDTDPNLTNVLITTDWKLWMIDFTRAFRLFKSLEDPKDLVMCDRTLFQRLKSLDENQVLEATGGHLSKLQVKALITRRDKIVDYFDKQAASKGEAAVFY